MRILSIDTSCDETAAAVTENTKILSNIIWSQASRHAKFGGVMPSLAQRIHNERINFVVEKALKQAFPKSRATYYQLLSTSIDAIAVTIGPGLAIALGVGVDKAKELAKKYNKPLIAVNHLEGHILSPFANTKYEIRNTKQIQNSNIIFPSLGLVVSGGNTLFVKIKSIGNYEILAQTEDDALGEALDKAARMLGLGYPGGAILEKFARLHKVSPGQTRGGFYTLPIPILGQEKRKIFTYSGLKTAMYRLVEKARLPDRQEKPLTKEKIYNLAACFQDVAFTHLTRVLRFIISNDYSLLPNSLLVGGGVAANIELRRRLRKLGREFNIKVLFPYSKKLCGDNAAMIGIAAYFKSPRKEFTDPEEIDRDPRLSLV